jgi:hypothetical protein
MPPQHGTRHASLNQGDWLLQRIVKRAILFKIDKESSRRL